MELSNRISIRMLYYPEELILVRNLESLIWADEDPVSVSHMIAVVKNGGMVIGAFEGDRLVGFQFSFPGYDGTNVHLCSHSLAIHPEFQKLGIGEKLKRKQREEALKKGYRRIQWTYDPLETVNGYLNLSKLGGICTKYIENCYGDMPDIINAGLPSDRFLVEWHIDENTPFTEEKIKGEQEVPLVIQVDYADGFPVPVSVSLDNKGESDTVFVPVPGNFQKIKTECFEAAKEWRIKTREVFSHYLSKGWIVTGLRKSDQPNLYFYVLKKQ